MTYKIDWQEVLDLAGDEPYHDSYVVLPAVSRLLLSQLVSNDRYLVQSRENVDYGTAYQDELYRYALTAYKQLMNPIDITTITSSSLALYSAVSEIMTMPNLVAFWPMSSGYTDPTDPNDNLTVRDVSGNGWDLEASNFPKLGRDDSLSLAVPSMYFDYQAPHFARTQSPPHLAVGASFSSSDAPGLTVCGMIKPLENSLHRCVISRWGTSGPYQGYYIQVNTTWGLAFVVKGGGEIDGINHSVGMGEWSFFCARYNPLTYLEIMVDNSYSRKTNLSTSFIDTAPSEPTSVGAIGDRANYFYGELSMLWVSQSFVSDARINHLRDLLLPLYGKEL